MAKMTEVVGTNPELLKITGFPIIRVAHVMGYCDDKYRFGIIDCMIYDTIRKTLANLNS